MRVIQQLRAAALLVCLCAATTVIARAQLSNAPTLGQVLERMRAAQQAEQNRPEYTVLREYRLSGADVSTPTSRVLAVVDYVPPGNKQFAIRKTEGSDRGEKIVRRVLEHEVRMTRDSSATDFTPSNYEFALLGQESHRGKRCYVLGLNPKHDSPELLKGRAWVDAESFLILRVEGAPAKTPSWWIKDLQVAIDYGRADGIWLPLSTWASADLRLLGTHVLTSRDIQVQAATQSAKLSRPLTVPARRKRAQNPAVDAAVWNPQ